MTTTVPSIKVETNHFWSYTKRSAWPKLCCSINRVNMFIFMKTKNLHLNRSRLDRSHALTVERVVRKRVILKYMRMRELERKSRIVIIVLNHLNTYFREKLLAKTHPIKCHQFCCLTPQQCFSDKWFYRSILKQRFSTFVRWRPKIFTIILNDLFFWKKKKKKAQYGL